MAKRPVKKFEFPETKPAVPTERDLARLARFRSRDGVLSLYLDFDAVGGERRKPAAAFVHALKSLDSLDLSPERRARLHEEQAGVEDFARKEFVLQGRSVILFSCRPRGLWSVFQLQEPVRPFSRFAERPAVAQLARMVDEYERYLVVLIDKEEARLLSVYLGQADARAHVTDEYPGRNKRGGWAQARYSHHRDAHLHRHVLHVTEALLDELRRQPFDKLLVGGPDEAKSALLHVLPRPLRTRVAGTFLAELFLSDAEIVERVRDEEQRAEHEAQATLVHDLLNTAGAGGPAALGWEEALQALAEGRVHELVLAEGRTRKGRVCAQGHVVLEPLRTCPFCGALLGVVNDLADWAAARAFDTDTSVRTASAAAGKALIARGDGVGALLRY
jgi:peptide chain release factor subunit 1